MKTAFRHIQIVPCAARFAKEAQGLHGFHNSQTCPDCQKIESGFTVHAGDSILSPLVSYYPDKETVISEHPVYFTR